MSENKYCAKCEGEGELTAVLDGRTWRMVLKSQAGNYEQVGRTVRCPDCRYGLEALELPVVAVK